MFMIKVSFNHHVRSGLNALDFRRRLGLSDGVTFHISTFSQHGVDESFARMHFGPEEVLSEVSVPVEALLPGELVERHGLQAELTDERARELFVVGKISELKKRIEKLNFKLEEKDGRIAYLEKLNAE